LEQIGARSDDIRPQQKLQSPAKVTNNVVLKAVEKGAKNTADKATEKATEKVSEKATENVSEKATEKVTGKPTATATKKAAESVLAASAQMLDAPEFGDGQRDRCSKPNRIRSRPEGIRTQQHLQSPVEKGAENEGEEATEKATGKATEMGTETTEKATEKATEKTTEKATEKGIMGDFSDVPALDDLLAMLDADSEQEEVSRMIFQMSQHLMIF